MAKKDTEENSASEYLQSLVNAANRISVWKWVAAFQVIVILGLIYALIMAVQSMPVRLVPHEFAASNGSYIIKSNGETNAEYLVHIAENDIKLLTDWMPATVERQYMRFLNRCTPELFAEKNIELLSDSKNLKGTSYTQVFYPTNRRFLGEGRVQVQGTLVRYAGERIVMQTPGVYTMSYRFFNGMPSIQEIQFSRPVDAKAAADTPQIPTVDPTVYTPVGVTEPPGNGPPPPEQPAAPPPVRSSNDPARSVEPDPSMISPAPSISTPVDEPAAGDAAAPKKGVLDRFMDRLKPSSGEKGEQAPTGQQPSSIRKQPAEGDSL